jgi:hypothetical protein
MNAKQSAIDAYLIRMASIAGKIGKVQKLADDHFGHDADTINWAHVGDLGRVEAILDELIGFVCPEME